MKRAAVLALLAWAASGCAPAASCADASDLICYENPADTSGNSVCCPAGYVIYDPATNKCVASSYGYSGDYWSCFSQ